MATASLIAGDKGSKYFWNFFKEKLVDKLPTLTPDEIC